MKSTTLGICFVLFAISVQAQSPPFAARKPALQAALGYSYVRLPVTQHRVGLNGIDASAAVHFTPIVAVRADLGYVRASNVFSSTHHADLLSYLAGPVLYPIRARKGAGYFQVLAGGARETTPIVDSTGRILFGGFANKFAWLAGGGAEHRLSRTWLIDLGVDYLHTAYFDETRAIRGQGTIRIAARLAYSFAPRER